CSALVIPRLFHPGLFGPMKQGLCGCVDITAWVGERKMDESWEWTDEMMYCLRYQSRRCWSGAKGLKSCFVLNLKMSKFAETPMFSLEVNAAGVYQQHQPGIKKL